MTPHKNKTAKTRSDLDSFVRINFTGELEIRLIKSSDTGFNPDGSEEVYSAEALDISTNATLCETTEPIPEGAVVALNLQTEDNTPFTDVLGLVKRVDTDDDAIVMGIEFIGRDTLLDLLENAELELLNERFVRFEDRMKHAVTSIVTGTPNRKQALS